MALFLNLFLDTITTNLADGNEVRIYDLGNFTLRDKKDRPGRNILTGESVRIPERRVTVFVVGHKLKSDLKRKK